MSTLNQLLVCDTFMLFYIVLSAQLVLQLGRLSVLLRHLGHN